MDDIYKQVSEQLNLPIETVKTAYMYFYKFIRDKITKTDIKDIDASELNMSFNIPSIGKLYFNKNKYIKIKEKYEKGKHK